MNSSGWWAARAAVLDVIFVNDLAPEQHDDARRDQITETFNPGAQRGSCRSAATSRHLQ